MKSIFVSSTFRDFHRERDLLRSRIIPEVNDTAKEYGEFVNLCDLRWGVDTSGNEDPEQTVLSVCLDEIDRSRPYMLVFLGERYGYVPGKEYICQEAEKRGLALKDLEISVTQLEIEYGAFHDRNTLDHTLFYFREIEDPQTGTDPGERQYREKMSALKRRILALAGEHVHFYRIGPDADASYEQLCRSIRKHLEEIFLDEWKLSAGMCPEEKDHQKQWNYVREKAGYFKVGAAFAGEVMEQIGQEETSVCFLTGDMGTGKSTCFSFICTEMEKKGWDVLPVMCGNTALSTDEEQILRCIVWLLEKRLEVPHLSEEKKEADDAGKRVPREEKMGIFRPDSFRSENRRFQERLLQLYRLYGQTGRRLLLAVDAADQLPGGKDLRSLLFLPQEKEKNIKVLLTVAESGSSLSDAVQYRIPPLGDEDRKDVIDRVLLNNGKRLSDDVCHVLFQKENSRNPLFLYLAANHLCLMDEEDYNWIGQFEDFMEGTNRRQSEIVNQFPDDLEQMAAETLRKSSRVIQSAAVDRCMDYLSVSRHGLRSMDLEQLLNREGLRFVPLHFSQVIHSMNELYTLRLDGRYDFLHRALREGILESLSEDERKLLHRRIAEYLMTLPGEDSVRQQELSYHLIQADMGKEYIRSISAAVRKKLPELEFFGEELYRQCMEDHGYWILKLAYQSLAPDKQDSAKRFRQETAEDLLHALYYFETEGAERFLESRAGLQEYYEILTDLIEILERAEKGSLNQEGWSHVMALGYAKMGDLLVKMESLEDLAKAGEYFDRAIRLRERMLKKERNDFNAMELAIAFQEKGDWLDEIGSSKSMEAALALYEQAEIWMEAALSVNRDETYMRNYANLCSRIGFVHHQMSSQKELQIALKYYQQAEDILHGLIRVHASGENLLGLSNLLRRIAGTYIDMESNENIRRAIALYEEASELVMNAYDGRYTSGCVDELIDLRYRIAFACTMLDGQDALLRALETLKQAYRLAYEASMVRGLNANYRNMIKVCHGICTVSIRLAEDRYLEQALDYAHKGVDYARSLTSANFTMRNLSTLTASLCHQGEVYEAFGTDQALREARRFYDESLRWAEKLLQAEYGSVTITGEIIRVLEQTGYLYEKAGGVLNYKKALPYYEKALQMEEENMEKCGESPERQRNIEISCNKVGNAWMRIGTWEKDALEKARPYLERAMDIAVRLAEQIELDKYRWDLSFCFHRYAEWLQLTEGDPDEIRNYYLRAFEIRKRLNEKQKTLASRKSLAVSYEKLIIVYSRSSSYHDWAVAANYAQKFSDLSREIAENEKTVESRMDLANAYTLTGDQYARLGRSEIQYVPRAEAYYQDALKIWPEIIGEIRTYRAYTDYIGTYFRAAQLAVRMKQYDRAERCFEVTLALTEEFLKTEPEESYRLMLPDIYMEIADFYENIDREKYLEKCLDLYHRALNIYESVDTVSGNDKYTPNFSAICYSVACTAMMMGRYDEAIRYFERSIDLTLSIPEEKRDQGRIICMYSSYNRIGAMYLESGKMEQGIEYFRKAVACEEQALENIKDETRIMEILEDTVKDTLMLEDIGYVTGQTTMAETYSDKAIRFLYLLIQLCPEESTYQEQLINICIRQLQSRISRGSDEKEVWPYLKVILGILKEHPEYEALFNDLEKNLGIRIVKDEPKQKDQCRELEDLYERAEHYLATGKDEIGLQSFLRFLEQMEQLPDSQRSDKLRIYEYNAFNQLAAYYANKNTEEDYRRAISYFEKAVQKEREALKTVGEDRSQEIGNDIYEDCSHAIMLCQKMKENEKASWFYETALAALMTLAKDHAKEYEILLAREMMEYAMFQTAVMRQTENVPAMLAGVYALAAEHPELEDMKLMLEPLFQDMPEDDAPES